MKLEYGLESPIYNLIYLVIPKCACTSLIQWWACIHHDKIKDRPEARRKYGTHVNSDLTKKKMVVIRDPIDRFISAFCNKFVSMAIRNGHPDWTANLLLDRLKIQKKPTEITFIEIVDALNRESLHRLDPHWLPQSHYTLDTKFDYIINFNDLKNGLIKVCTDLNLECNLIHENKTNYRKVLYNAIETPVKDIINAGIIPDKESLLNPAIVTKLKEIYKADYDIARKNQN